MSIKSVVEAIEITRINNKNFSNSIEGKLNDIIRQLEDMKLGVIKETAEQDRDLVVVMEGKA